jgi:hypothetical protein
LFTPSWAAADHKPLLPHPQEVSYGSGQLPLHALSISVVKNPSPEDRFAAQQLSSCLTSAAKEPVPISEEKASAKTIALMRTGPVAPLALPGEQAGPMSREAYTIEVTSGGGQIHATSSAGLFYGVQTLCELIEGSGLEAKLPEVIVRDWPLFAYRGVMVDISHGAIPKEDEIKRQLDFLARWKTNEYYLYSEASIELEGYPLLNPDGRLSQDEVRRIVSYARERHIDVIPNLELYGHLHDLFRVEKYSGLSDLAHGTEFDPQNPKVLALLSNWVKQFANLFPSPFVHIGLDETFQIEMAARQQGASATPAKLYVKQLGDVTRLFQQHGKQVMAWGDIIVRYPEILSELPPGLIAVAWKYRTDPSDKEYKHWLGPLVAKSVPHFIEPGVTSWSQISPDFETTFENVDDFVAAGRQSKAQGVIQSVWTDSGQILLRMSQPGMAYGVVAAWQSAPMDRKNFFSDYAQLLYPANVAPDVSAALEGLTQAEADLQKVLGEPTMINFWQDPFYPAYFSGLAQHQERLRKIRLLAEEAESHVYRALAAGGDPVTLRCFVVGSRLLDYAGQKFQTPTEMIELWKQLGPKRPDSDRWWNEWESQLVYQDHSRIVDLMDAITELRALYKAEWVEEYEPYRLGSALGRWDAEYQYWRGVQQRLQQFADSSQEGDTLPPLGRLLQEHPR